MINNIFLKNFFLKWASLTLFKVLGGDINKKNPPTFVRCSVNCAFTIFQFLVHWKTYCQAWSILLVFFSDIQFQSHPALNSFFRILWKSCQKVLTRCYRYVVNFFPPNLWKKYVLFWDFYMKSWSVYFFSDFFARVCEKLEFYFDYLIEK